jgi:hypothetical protein
VKIASLAARYYPLRVHGAEQLIVFGVPDKEVVVPENLTRIECGCPFFKLAGTANLNP